MNSATRNTLFALAGIAGLGGTIALTAIGTYRTTLKIQKRKEELGVDRLPRNELFRIIFPNFAIPLAAGLATGGVMIASGIKATITEKSLASGAEMIKKTYRDYREKGIELFGKEQDMKILTEIKKDKMVEADPPRIVVGCIFGDRESILLPDDYTDDEGEMMFHIDYFDKDGEGVYFTSTVPKVMNAIYHFNRTMWVGFGGEEFYRQSSLLSFLGVEPTRYSEELTYSYLLNDDITWIDISIGEKTNVGDNMVCRPIILEYPPVHESLIDEWGNVKEIQKA